MGRAETPGRFEFAVDQIDRDYLARPGDPRALDYRRADAAGAEDCNRGTWPDFGSVQRRSDAGRDRTSEQRGTVKRYVVGDLYDRPFVQKHHLGKRCQIGELLDRDPIL